MSHVGELAAVATSVAWTICSLGFALAGRRVGALAVNQIRIVAAVAILIAVHAAIHGTAFPSTSNRQLLYLVLSGVVGLALGDLFYFHSITVLGPRLGSLLMATAPLFAAVLAWPMLGEALGAMAVVGIALTVGGVYVVLADRRTESGWDPDAALGSRRVAVVAGLLGALGQGLGLVLTKMGMEAHGDELGVEPLPATLVRMMAGMVAIVIIAVFGGHVRATLRATRDRRAMGWTMLGVVFGPTLGVWLSVVAVKHTSVGVASALSALPPVLMIPVARIAYGARPGRIAILGTVIAVAGLAVLFLLKG